MRNAAAVLAAMALGACATGGDAPPGESPSESRSNPPSKPPIKPDANACDRVQATGNWVAFIDLEPPVTRPRPLQVTGEVTTNSGGWTVELRAIGQTRSIPAMQMLELVARPPTGPTTAALETHRVAFSLDNPPAINRVVIRCNRSVIADLTVARGL